MYLILIFKIWKFYRDRFSKSEAIKRWRVPKLIHKIRQKIFLLKIWYVDRYNMGEMYHVSCRDLRIIAKTGLYNHG